MGSDAPLAVLCRKLGNLWSEDDAGLTKAGISVTKQKESDLMLYRKLYSKPNVDFHAFLSTMKRAWKYGSQNR